MTQSLNMNQTAYIYTICEVRFDFWGSPDYIRVEMIHIVQVLNSMGYAIRLKSTIESLGWAEGLRSISPLRREDSICNNKCQINMKKSIMMNFRAI